jgi:hypothetical protein
MNKNNDVKYCVSGTTGRKIAPYTSEYKPKPENWFQRNIRYPYNAILIWLASVATVIVTLLLLTSCSMPLKCGDPLGEFNGVYAYYNDGYDSCEEGRHLSSDGYSYGMRWQCVEYIRRYYKDVFDHEMTIWGHASGYFEENVKNGGFNETRQLTQYDNGMEKPQVHDIIVWRGKHGHVAIVTGVTDTTVTTIAQNIGPYCKSTMELDGNTIGPGFNIAGILRLEQ